MKNLFFTLLLLFNAVLFGQNALNFDGVNDQIQTTFSGVLGSADRTFEAWVFVPTGLSATIGIMDYGLNVVGSRNTLNINTSYGVGYLSGGTNANISSTTNAITPGQWNHVAFVLSSGTGFIYVNGVQVGTGNLTTVNTPSGGANLIIGQRVSGGSLPFLGSIDEIRIWNVARTQTQIAADMNTEFCALPSGLVAYYKFNQGTALGNNTGVTTLTEEVAGNNGTLQNFALLGATSNWVVGATLNAGVIPGANVVVSECNSYTLPSGSIISTSGIYSDTLTSSSGCDSVNTYDITILTNSSSTISVNACESYTSPSGTVYTASGTYTDTIANSAGCDSIITINLSIDTVSVMVTQNGNTLTAQQSGGIYQWLDCQNGFMAIPGATMQSFTPSTNGSYAVRIDANGCVDTSLCTIVSGIGSEENTMPGISIYPNPSNGPITLKTSVVTNSIWVRITDLAGREIVVANFENTQVAKIDAQLSSGSYIVYTEIDGGHETHVLIIE